MILEGKNHRAEVKQKRWVFPVRHPDTARNDTPDRVLGQAGTHPAKEITPH